MPIPGWAPGPARLRDFFATALGTLLVLALALACSNIYAAEAQRRTWHVSSDQPVVLETYYEIQESDCRAMRAPPVIITTRPVLGKLVVNTTSGLADKTPKCRHVKVPVTRVVYQPGPTPGRDDFGWQIYFQARDLGTQSVKGTAVIGPRTPVR